MTLLGRAQQFLAGLASKAPVGTEHDAVRRDRLDQMTLAEVHGNAPKLGQLTHRLHDEDGWKASTDLVDDVFSHLWQHAPKFSTPERLAPGNKINLEVTRELAEHPEMKRLRESSVGDEYVAAMATLSMAGELRRVAQQAKEAEEAAQKAADAQQQAQAAAAALQAQVGAGGGNDEALAAALTAAEAAQDAALQAEAQAAQQSQRAAENAATGMGGQIAEAAEQAEKEKEVMAAYGRGPGELQRMPFAERAALAEQLSKGRMAKFAHLIGRWKLQAAAQRVRRTQYGRDVVVGVELSRDLSRVLPVEFVRAQMHPALKVRFARDLANGQLLSRKYEGTEKVGSGPMVICVDVSGSMLGGDPSGEAWAKAVTIALLDQARHGKRDAHVILFDDGISGEYAFPSGADPLANLIAMTECMTGGGTDLLKPLTRALRIVTDRFDQDGKPKADVVLISDGYAPIGNVFAAEWAEAKARIGFRCFGVAVNSRVPAVFDRIADNSRSIEDLSDVGSMNDVLATV